MSSSTYASTSSFIGLLGIPMIISAIAIVQLKDVLEVATSEFFNTFTLTQQVSCLALIFSIIFASVATATTTALSSTGDNNKGSNSTVSVARSSSTNTTTTAKIVYPLKEIAAANNDKDKFKALFPTIKKEILTYLKVENELLLEAEAWINDMIDYSVPGGKLNRGTTVLSVVRTLKGQELTDIETARAAVLGWTIEFLQAFFLVADDIMDDSQTRRGNPCWYKLSKVNMIAINDSFLLESFVFQILRTHFSQESYYYDLLELMLDVTQKTEIGQLLDLTSQSIESNKKVDLNRFTMERYQMIVKYKTAYYSFYLPVAMGMLMSNIRNIECYTIAKNVCCIMGEYFQIQDDYLDCYGSPEVIGKVGTDIQDNKCSWLIVQALLKCTPGQKKILEENYGIWDDKKVAKVKTLYNELNIKQIFEQYEEDSYQKIQKELYNIQHNNIMPKDVFELLFKKIYKRSK